MSADNDINFEVPAGLKHAYPAVNARDRYLNDNMFHACTDSMVSMIMKGHLTAQEVAQCAVLAAQIYAERYCVPMVIRIDGPAER